MFLIGTCAGVLAWILAPRKEVDFPVRYSFYGQQVAKVVMLLSVCIGIGGGAMCLEQLPLPEQETTSLSKHAQGQVEAVIGIPMLSKTKARKPLKRAFSNWFQGAISKRATKRMRSLLKRSAPKERTTLGNVMGTFAVLLLSLILVYLVGILSCSLSCNGNITLSYIVLIGGLGLIILLAVKLLKSIHRKKEVVPQPDL